MITFPNAKINLGLNITERRPDGYHNIETVFYPIPIHDALEIVESDSISLTISGLKIDGNAEQNLIMKAYRLLASSFELPKVEINLLKKNTIWCRARRWFVGRRIHHKNAKRKV